ncbi:MAG: glycerol-3-phosphate 1-O-acyltransferase PlsY [Blastomonas sp.]
MDELAKAAMIAIILLFAMGYLLGSIPFGIVLTRIAGAGDLRTIGSGNIGATNVLRTGRKGLAALTLLFDLLKGAAAVWAAQWALPDSPQFAGSIAALGAFFGHLYPIWLKFRGGKGIATLIGIALALYWPIGLVFVLVWAVMAAIFRISSLAGITAAASAPVAALALGQEGLIWLFVVTLVFTLLKHRGNIARLMAGEEPRIGKS